MLLIWVRTVLIVLCATLVLGLSSSRATAAEGEPSADLSEASSESTGPEDGTESASEEPHDGGWEYDDYYIFPLTRHMPDSELPMAGQIALYPFAFLIDLVQWPFGALVGLGGE